MEKTLLTLIFCALVSLSSLTLADSFNRTAMLVIDNTARNNNPVLNPMPTPMQSEKMEIAQQQFQRQSQNQGKDLTHRIEEYVEQANAKQSRDFDLNHNFGLNDSDS